MSSEQIISYLIGGLDEEIAAHIMYINPRTVNRFEDIARNIEKGRELLVKSKPQLEVNVKAKKGQCIAYE